MQIMKHLITTVGEPKMKGGGGVGGRGGEGWIRRTEATRQQEEGGSAEADGR